MTSQAVDVTSLRARFAALDRPTAFLDGAGGTQCPDEVIEAIAAYLQHDNANTGGAFGTSQRTDALIEEARSAASRFLRCKADEVVFGASATSMNFLLTRALARQLEPGDEVLVTRLDHDANVAPWLELHRDMGIVARFVEPDDRLTVDIDDLAAKRTPRTRIVAFPAASNGVGTTCDVARIAELAHEAGALAWVDAVHLAPHAPIDFHGWGADVVICSSYKAFGPHMAVAAVRDELLERWRPYKVRPAADRPLGYRHEPGTAQHELLAGFIAAVAYMDSVGWEAIGEHERSLGRRFLRGLPGGVRLFGPATMDARVPTFAFRVAGQPPDRSAARLAVEYDIAVWSGDHYAVELARHLGVEHTGGTVRASFVHYNTDEEVDRLLTALEEL
jgi:cysteine desulfurase family protein (TIGR01976 family)